MTSGWDSVPSPYVELSRDAWRALRENTPLPLTHGELDALRGLKDPIDITEVEEVYLPLSRLLNLFFLSDGGLRDTVSGFLGEPVQPTPFIIGVAGSVAVGKSTTSRLLRTLLARWPEHPSVELVTTDSFLHPNAVLAERGIMDRKGFPESYDRRALVRFVSEIKAGAEEVSIPIYSHLEYDIVPGARQTVRRPDILIVEGLNVLQAPPAGSLGVSDFFDFSIYVDARVEDIRQWYVERLFALRRTAFADPRSYFHKYAQLDEDEAAAFAQRVWRDVNEINLVSNILPTRARATLVLHKGRDHAVEKMRLRRI
ncbi:type I pantothenate kinase [Actinomadura barringtoniae]|uniref:Pantothenate kinase n=1 Tax=Actinomadura barringtoniae TaxID=1427535 RepID=A0A939TA97_9ACTN|nr:type I pantothenate kinase [Actinomadura barringtoniae]MBO2452242.1 type I pantothenate kinase [Actinomadura barringtoniae]